MEDSWRFRPPPPPPPAFDYHPAFPSDNDPYFSRQLPPPRAPTPPFFDPAFHHQSWNGLLHPLYPPPWRLPSDQFFDREGVNKRMRVGDHMFAPMPAFYRFDPEPRIMVAEDERRLNLIRDHGRHSCPSLKVNQHTNGDYGMQGQYWSPGATASLPNGHGAGFIARAASPLPVYVNQNNSAVANPYGGFRDSLVPIDHRKDLSSEAVVVDTRLTTHPCLQDRELRTCSSSTSPASGGLEEWALNDKRDQRAFSNVSRSSHGSVCSSENQQILSMENPSHCLLERPKFPVASSNNSIPIALNSEKVSAPREGMSNTVKHEKAHSQLYDRSDNSGRSCLMLAQLHSSQVRAHPQMGYGTAPLARLSGLASERPYGQYMEEVIPTFPPKEPSNDKPVVVDACQLFKQPYRSSRPDHFVVILRGLPGSGKSYIAKLLRDIEVENGGNVPRVHAMDDYFMIEVEKVEDNDVSKASGLRGKKQGTKKVIEYCYEPEMEEVYRTSMLKAFKKTLDEGIYKFIIVDDRNLRVADFAQFWATAKRSGYEVYLLEATYKDPTGCAARNVHGFALEDIQKMAGQWEVAPSFYLQLDIQLLFHSDDLKKDSIQEVDMDMDDSVCDEYNEPQMEQDRETHNVKDSIPENHEDNVSETHDIDEEQKAVKELGKSKWSKDLEEYAEHSDSRKVSSSAISGPILQARRKGGNLVHWGDQVDKSGFSIGARKRPISSLVIGPGSGYNLNSNPLSEEEDASLELTGSREVKDSNKQFYEQLRAERESFKAVFDGRRQRIGVLNFDDEDD